MDVYLVLPFYFIGKVMIMYYKQKNLSAIIATQSQSLTKNKDKKKFL
jgi:hypothetical protein